MFHFVIDFLFFFRSINLFDFDCFFKGVNLLLKNSNISPSNPVRLPAHRVRTEHCQCHRSFHIFCTDLLPKNEQDIDMIYIHPAPRNHDRDLSRRVSTPWRKFHRKYHEDNEQDNVSTTRSEPNQMTISESQSLEKKVLVICVFNKLILICMQFFRYLLIK